MNIPQLPNDIIMEILKHRKNIKYLDRKYEEQQKHKINLLLLENINNYNYFEKSFESMVLITFDDD